MITTYNIYRNELIEASWAENNGSVSLSFFDFSQQNNGMDDHNSEIVGTLSVDRDWTLCLSESGLPLFQNSNRTTVLLEGEFAEDFRLIGTKYDGLRYSQSVSDSSIDLAKSAQWQEIDNDLRA